MRKFLLFSAIIFCSFTGPAQGIAKMKMTDVVRLFNNKSDTIYVVNFWASFCKPCVAEIPDFIKITDKYKNQKVKLLLVSLDLASYYPARIAAFVKAHHFNTNIAWLNETDADYFCPMIDSSWSGTIPATIIVNAKTGYKRFWEGDVKEVVFEKELKQAIEEPQKSTSVNKFSIPMKRASIIKHEPTLFTDMPSHGVSFKSKDSTVYSVDEGIVGNCITIEGIQVLIIEHKGISYFYSNLQQAIVKKGDVIMRNQPIGYAATELEESMYTLNFNLFKQSEEIPLTKNDFIVNVNENIKDHSFDPVKEPE